MSIKNQNRFTIIASLIVGVTILALIGLNLIVDKISKINTSQVASQAGVPNPRSRGLSPEGSEADTGPKPNANPDNTPPKIPHAPPTNPGSSGVSRRVNSGRNGAEFEQKNAPPPNSNQRPNPAQPQQPDMRQGYPSGYPDPSRMSPDERDAFEREMMRRQQMMQEYPYDYPPPEYFQNPYDRFEDDYDYDRFQGQRNDAKSSQVKLSDSGHSPDYDEEEDEDYDDYLHDDYLRDGVE